MSEKSIVPRGGMDYYDSSGHIGRKIAPVGIFGYSSNSTSTTSKQAVFQSLSAYTAARKSLPASQADSIHCKLLAILNLAGAGPIKVEAHRISVFWPNATPWLLVVVQDVPSSFVVDAWFESEALAGVASDFHLVALEGALFDCINLEDVRRADDIQRRRRVLRGYDRFEFTADAAFVQDVKLRALRLLQQALEASPSGDLYKALDFPLAVPSDDELMRDGPSLGDRANGDASEIFSDTAEAGSACCLVAVPAKLFKHISQTEVTQ